MNERILKLANKAGMRTWGVGNGDNVSEVITKFAELVAQDCVDIVKNPAVGNTQFAADLIKERFDLA